MRQVRVVVSVPADTPADADVYLAGSMASVGNWTPDGAKLTRQADGSYAADIDLEVGQVFAFKFTRGTWETVERRADDSDRENRTTTIGTAMTRIDANVERWAAGPPARARTVVGTLRLHTIESAALKASRTIRVWLPPGYDADSNGRYAVLYMHDGQNCFDRATSAFGNEWEIDETLAKLIDARAAPPLIVVGIDHGGAARIDEYTFVADPRRGGGAGERHAAFLLGEVMPLVEKTYRVRTGRAHTLLGGSSLGGLSSLEIARRHGDVFGGVMAVSPSLWWADESLTAAVESDPKAFAGTRVWLDTGTREEPGNAGQQHVVRTRRLDAALTARGIAHRLVVAEGAEHSEPAWAKRFPDALTYLLGSE